MHSSLNSPKGGRLLPVQGNPLAERGGAADRNGGITAAMLLRLSGPASAEDLMRFFHAHGYLVERRGEALVDVEPADPLGGEADRERVVRDLEAWQAWNPGADVTLVD
jgi:hypothetical protein